MGTGSPTSHHGGGGRQAAHRLSTPLESSFFARTSREVAQALIGKVVVSTIDDMRVAGRIVETEAYLGPADPASHAAVRIGRTERNSAMFGSPGTAYVYLSYGIHWCLNAVTDREDHPGAVLIRALEPVAGLATMRRRRGTPDRDLARGPGRLCQALGITIAQNGRPLDQPPLLFVDAPAVAPDAMEAGPRIGISKAVDWPLRFTLRGSRYLSR